VRRKLAHSRHDFLPAAGSLTQLVLDFAPWKTARPISRGARERISRFRRRAARGALRRYAHGRPGAARLWSRSTPLPSGFLDFARHCGFQPRLRAPYRAQITDVSDKRFFGDLDNLLSRTGDRVAKSRGTRREPCRAALSSLLLCGARARLRPPWVPAGNKARISGLGLLDPARTWSRWLS
jgi:hypothetical protein